MNTARRYSARNQKDYPSETAEYTDRALSDIVHMTGLELAEVADRTTTFDLKDTRTIKERTMVYIRACEECAVIPSMLGLSVSLGYCRKSLELFRQQNPTHPTTQWLELFHDKTADARRLAAEKSIGNPIVHIFLLKALNGFRDTVTIEAANAPESPLGAEQSSEDIVRKYRNLALPADFATNSDSDTDVQ